MQLIRDAKGIIVDCTSRRVKVCFLLRDVEENAINLFELKVAVLSRTCCENLAGAVQGGLVGKGMRMK